MHKTDLVDEVAEKCDLTKSDAKEAVEAFIETIEESLCRNEKVTLMGFGTFEARHRKGRKGRNPATGEEMNIPAAYLPAFRASKNLKEKVKESVPAE